VFRTFLWRSWKPQTSNSYDCLIAWNCMEFI